MSTPIELAKKFIAELTIAACSIDHTQIEVNDAIECAKGYHHALIDNSLITKEQSEELRELIKSMPSLISNVPKGKYIFNFHGKDIKLFPSELSGEVFSFSKKDE